MDNARTFACESESNELCLLLFISGAHAFFRTWFVTYVILAERKVMGFIQLRKGPNQVGGSWGLLQTVADVLKLLIKEDIDPKACRSSFI